MAQGFCHFACSFHTFLPHFSRRAGGNLRGAFGDPHLLLRVPARGGAGGPELTGAAYATRNKPGMVLHRVPEPASLRPSNGGGLERPPKF